MTLSKLWKKIKNISYEWLPLTGMVTMVYMIQRGFLAIHKAGIAPEGVDIKGAMSIFFTATAFGCLGLGFLADRLKTEALILVAAISGTIGILMLGINPIIFGILMGLSAAVAKMVPFMGPLKTKTTKHEAMRITPQALGKQLGAALMMFVLGASIKVAGFGLFTSILAPVWLGACLWAWYLVQKYDIKLLKWNWESVKATLSNWKLYVYALWYAAMAVTLYTVLPMIIPTFISMEMTKAEAVTLYGTLGLCLMWLRFGWSWLADKFNIHLHLMLASVAIYTLAVFLMPTIPVIAIGAVLVMMQSVTPCMWTTAKKWFGSKYMGTAMGIVMIFSYIIIGLYLGKW